MIKLKLNSRTMRCESCGFFVGESKNFFKGFKRGIFDLLLFTGNAHWAFAV